MSQEFYVYSTQIGCSRIIEHTAGRKEKVLDETQEEWRGACGLPKVGREVMLSW